ncbi:hypothetical protein L6164_034039 [Bauhinia variegata]|uniref:Uncharacterized protein n=1 Tax=Bauhinia variegata TaxID=167791 RepID=A0ACB9KUD0_BAUVA|nr:hypothetical protein L6164_034039 [Bauhinia variegata]
MFSMENGIRKHTFMGTSNSPSLAMHRDSQTISKTKPKIRIIHIFAPKIIKTDVENFRELVQRLTGKPSGDQKYCKKKPRIAGRDREAKIVSGHESEKPKRMIAKSMELRNGFVGLDQSRDLRIKEEAGLCSYENSGGYLGGFPDLEGFISEIAEFPLLPLDGNHMQGFGEPQLA